MATCLLSTIAHEESNAKNHEPKNSSSPMHRGTKFKRILLKTDCNKESLRLPFIKFVQNPNFAKFSLSAARRKRKKEKKNQRKMKKVQMQNDRDCFMPANNE